MHGINQCNWLSKDTSIKGYIKWTIVTVNVKRNRNKSLLNKQLFSVVQFGTAFTQGTLFHSSTGHFFCKFHRNFLEYKELRKDLRKWENNSSIWNWLLSISSWDILECVLCSWVSIRFGSFLESGGMFHLFSSILEICWLWEWACWEKRSDHRKQQKIQKCKSKLQTKSKNDHAYLYLFSTFLGFIFMQNQSLSVARDKVEINLKWRTWKIRYRDGIKI